jgi:hypothetical protein
MAGRFVAEKRASGPGGEGLVEVGVRRVFGV